VTERAHAIANPPTRGGKLPWLKPGVLAGALLPLALLLVRAARHTLGADPVAIALNQLGLLALIFLVASLMATPLKLVFAVTWPIRIRRLLGLVAFFYACLHFALYAVIDQGLDYRAIAADVAERKFITAGFAAFLLLIPLAATSTSGMLKRLGARRWKRLHRLAYVAGTLGCLHFIWRVKRDLTEPALYAAMLALLFSLRVVSRPKPRARTE
jgi:sulfoxide reductase heme-binding subunit YedZ